MTPILALISIYLLFYDIRFKRVPNIINLSLLIAVIISKYILADGLRLTDIYSGLAAFLTFFIIHLVSRGGLGIGDCKYTAIIALNFGYLFWLKSTILCSILALIITGTLLFMGKTDRRTRIPFMPFIVTGWLLIKSLEFIT